MLPLKDFCPLWERIHSTSLNTKAGHAFQCDMEEVCILRISLREQLTCRAVPWLPGEGGEVLESGVGSPDHGGGGLLWLGEAHSSL